MKLVPECAHFSRPNSAFRCDSQLWNSFFLLILLAIPRDIQGDDLNRIIPPAFPGSVERKATGKLQLRFGLQTAANQRLEFSIAQRNAAIHVVLRSQKGQVLSDSHGLDGLWRLETLYAISRDAGNCLLDIQVDSVGPKGGSFSIQLIKPRPSDVSDSLFLEAQAAYLKGLAVFRTAPADTTSALYNFEAAASLSREVGDLRREAAANSGMARILEKNGRPAEALKIESQSIDLYQKAGDRYGAATVLNHMGALYRAISEKVKSLEAYEKASNIWKDLGDQYRHERAETYNYIADLYEAEARTKEAVGIRTESIKLLREIGDSQTEASTQASLAQDYSTLGDSQKALAEYLPALRLNISLHNLRGETETRSGVAEAYFALGEYSLARDQYQLMLQKARQLTDKALETSALNGLGTSYTALHNNRQALVSLNLANQIAKSANLLNQQGELLHNLASLYYEFGRFADAVKSEEESNRIFVQLKNRRNELATLSGLGRLYIDTGDSEKGEKAFRDALELSRALGDRDQEMYILGNTARHEKQVGQLKPALEHINFVIDIANEMRAKVVRDDLRASYFSYIRPAFESKADILMRLNAAEPGKGWDRQAFEVSESAHARSMLERVPTLGATLKPDVPEDLLSRQKKVADRIQARAASTEAVDDLLAEYYNVQREIQLQDPRYADLVQPRALTTETAMREVGPDTIALEYLMGEFKSYVWLISNTEFASFELPGRKQIIAAAQQVQTMLRAHEGPCSFRLPVGRQLESAQIDAEYWKSASKLSHMILAPLGDRLQNKRILIVADGALQLIPFAALPVGKASSSQSPTPLMLRNQVIMVDSLSVLAEARRLRKAGNSATRPIGIIADPVYEPADDRLLKASSGSAGRKQTARLHGAGDDMEPELFQAMRLRSGQCGSYTRLFGAADEVEAIKKSSVNRAVTIRTGFDASRQFALSGALESFGLLHFATHGMVNDDNPELSGLVLSRYDRDGHGQRGFLRLVDVYSLRLRSDLVVLSACETALGRNVDGEGIIGLTRGFLYAGSHRVISTLWRVQDDSTVDFMAAFYPALLRNKLAPAEALRTTQVQMWNSRRWHSPYYWAAFVIYGD